MLVPSLAQSVGPQGMENLETPQRYGDIAMTRRCVRKPVRRPVHSSQSERRDRHDSATRGADRHTAARRRIMKSGVSNARWRCRSVHGVGVRSAGIRTGGPGASRPTRPNVEATSRRRALGAIRYRRSQAARLQDRPSQVAQRRIARKRRRAATAGGTCHRGRRRMESGHRRTERRGRPLRKRQYGVGQHFGGPGHVVQAFAPQEVRSCAGLAVPALFS